MFIYENQPNPDSRTFICSKEHSKYWCVLVKKTHVNPMFQNPAKNVFLTPPCFKIHQKLTFLMSSVKPLHFRLLLFAGFFSLFLDRTASHRYLSYAHLFEKGCILFNKNVGLAKIRPTFWSACERLIVKKSERFSLFFIFKTSPIYHLCFVQDFFSSVVIQTSALNYILI